MNRPIFCQSSFIRHSSFDIRHLIVVGCLTLLAGCGPSGPELGTVKGKVTLDGAPVPEAKVEFQPEDKGSASYGTTDKQGKYTLFYAAGRPGAMVGKHVVRIETYRQMPSGRDVPERLPAWCHSETKLTREVTSGANEINFEINSKNPPK